MHKKDDVGLLVEIQKITLNLFNKFSNKFKLI